MTLETTQTPLRNRFFKLPPLAAAFLTGAFAISGAAPARADAAIDGTWTGGGVVSFSNGNRERARCRITFSTTSASTVAANGLCATASGSASQTATLRKAGTGVYVGNFLNPEYGVSGRIRVVVRGRSQSMTLISTGGTASLALSR